jgi:hypothetical protein
MVNRALLKVEEQILLKHRTYLGYHKYTGTKYLCFEDRTITPFCTKEKSFTITIIPFTALPNYADQFDCNSYTPADTNGGIYYGTNKGLPILTPGTIITSTKSIFVYKETATIPLNCTSQRCLPFT